jgi:hypothetical protein
VNGHSEIAGFRFFGGTPSRRCFDFDTVWRNGNDFSVPIPIARAGGGGDSPSSFGIGADPGHHEHRSTKSSRP